MASEEQKEHFEIQKRLCDADGKKYHAVRNIDGEIENLQVIYEDEPKPNLTIGGLTALARLPDDGDDGDNGNNRLCKLTNYITSIRKEINEQLEKIENTEQRNSDYLEEQNFQVKSIKEPTTIIYSPHSNLFGKLLTKLLGKKSTKTNGSIETLCAQEQHQTSEINKKKQSENSREEPDTELGLAGVCSKLLPTNPPMCGTPASCSYVKLEPIYCD